MAVENRVKFQCDLYLLVKHPSMEPERITENLSLKPDLVQKSRTQIEAPNGKVLDNKYTWSTWQYMKPILEKEKLRSELMALVSHLENKESFINELFATEGRVSIFFRGSNNPHDSFTLDTELMKNLCALGISFGFEFFANQNTGKI